MSDAPIQYVNEHDEPVDSGPVGPALEKGLICRVVWIAAEDGQGNILLQKRSPRKETFPNHWAISVGGYVDAGETYEQAARREMAEEIGIAGVNLERLGHFFCDSQYKNLKLRRYATAYKTILKETPKLIEASELSAIKWQPIGKVKQAVLDQPEKFEDGLRELLTRYY